jgi:hypothetical protein
MIAPAPLGRHPITGPKSYAWNTLHVHPDPTRDSPAIHGQRPAPLPTIHGEGLSMKTSVPVRGSRAAQHAGARIALLVAFLVASAAGISAHIVRGVLNPTLATAFVSSPTGAQDLPVKIAWPNRDTALRVVCFNAANTSVPRVDDPDWPRITAVGFELPGSLSGFALLEPLDGDWELVEGTRAPIPGHETVTLDFALKARVNPAGESRRGPHELLGITPGQPAVRGSGTRFCVSGPFPDSLPNPADPNAPITTTVEQILNGVVVGFHRVQPQGPSTDVGLWENLARTVPLYPE